MKGTTIYIPADSEDYTGYSTHVLMGTDTSDTRSFTLTEDEVFYEFDQSTEEEDKELDFPESREEQFLEPKLQEFYEKKGYKF
jgi:hypothetical protein